MTTMIRIPLPGWARPFERSIDPAFGNAEYQRTLEHQGTIIALVHEAVQAYVHDPSLTVATSAIGFPARDRLTGEYYLRSESYWVVDEPWFKRVGRNPEYRFSYMACCLEPLWHPNQTDQDYLGLEVLFSWDPVTGTFAHNGDVDSSCI